MIDGPIARKLKAESDFGSRIDSVADLVFVICCAILILPTVDLPLWMWLWIAVIGTVKIVGIVAGSCRQERLQIPHSFLNRLTGAILFSLPFAFKFFGVLIPAVIACACASLSAFPSAGADS